ncbi:MAG: hypothetical protein F6K21_33620 [Symploca sp. SIO2D2]|nr:hypothetical protein [Symploca sp. SIO2D2]
MRNAICLHQLACAITSCYRFTIASFEVMSNEHEKAGGRRQEAGGRRNKSFPLSGMSEPLIPQTRIREVLNFQSVRP